MSLFICDRSNSIPNCEKCPHAVLHESIPFNEEEPELCSDYPSWCTQLEEMTSCVELVN